MRISDGSSDLCSSYLVAIARERSAHRYRDWPGAEKALGASFAIEDRFVRALDQEALTLALSRSAPAERFEELLDLFAAKIQSMFGDVRPDCIVVCLPDEAAAMRTSNQRLPARERGALDRLQREEEPERLSLFQNTPVGLKA